MKYLSDVMLMIGLIMLGVGAGHRLGWDIGTSIVGGLLIAIAIASAVMNRGE